MGMTKTMIISRCIKGNWRWPFVRLASWLSIYMQMQKSEAKVIIVSFPKCGRTWLRLMIGRVFADHYGAKEVCNILALDKMARKCPEIPCIRVTHDDDPQNKTPEELLRSKAYCRGTKVLLLVRDPKDVVVSLYFQKNRREGCSSDSISEFIRNRRGGLETIIEWYNIWAANMTKPSEFLLVRYEDMHADCAEQLKRVLGFIGVVDVSSECIQSAVEYGQFENMRELERANAFNTKIFRPADPKDPESFKTRRGVVGGYSKYLSSGDIEYMNLSIRDKLSDVFEFYKL